MDRQFMNNVEMFLARIEARLEKIEQILERRGVGK